MSNTEAQQKQQQLTHPVSMAILSPTGNVGKSSLAREFYGNFKQASLPIRVFEVESQNSGSEAFNFDEGDYEIISEVDEMLVTKAYSELNALGNNVLVDFGATGFNHNLVKLEEYSDLSQSLFDGIVVVAAPDPKAYKDLVNFITNLTQNFKVLKGKPIFIVFNKIKDSNSVKVAEKIATDLNIVAKDLGFDLHISAEWLIDERSSVDYLTENEKFSMEEVSESKEKLIKDMAGAYKNSPAEATEITKKIVMRDSLMEYRKQVKAVFDGIYKVLAY